MPDGVLRRTAGDVGVRTVSRLNNHLWGGCDVCGGLRLEAARKKDRHCVCQNYRWSRAFLGIQSMQSMLEMKCRAVLTFGMLYVVCWV